MSKRTIIELIIVLILGSIMALSAYLLSNHEYSQGYNNGHADGYHSGKTAGYGVGYSNGHISGYASGYNDGENTGVTTGEQDELTTIENWMNGVSCERTISGYIYFKLYQDTHGQFTYSCLVNTY